MKFPLKIVDVFAVDDQSFTGNPASVCILNFDDDISDEIKQKIASQMNLSTTAFVAKAWNKESEQERGVFTLRWFTPTMEIDICGHATIAASRAIFDRCLEYFESGQVKFQTKHKGIWNAFSDSKRETVTLELPLIDCKPIDLKSNPWTQEIINNILGTQLMTSDVIDVQFSSEVKYLLIRLKDDNNLISKVSPDFNKLLKIKANDSIKALIVTQRTKIDKNIHFYSRVFCPWIGINEDPATGSAHSVLAPYWKRQYKEMGIHLEQLVGKQCSKRGGLIICQTSGERVKISGMTRVVVTGNINL